MADSPPIIVMVTTFNRPDLLNSRALASISRQNSTFDKILLVDNSDSEKTRRKNQFIFRSFFPSGHYFVNERSPGAAGTWNHGLNWIHSIDPDAWVAIIDDDDEWTPNHLKVCRKHMSGNDAVISGIRTLFDGEPINEWLPNSFSIKDFFAKNPGWQGSNTFIRVSKLLEAGGFDEKLLCTHDRDMAIRCLNLENFNYALTSEVTLLYHLETQRDSFTMTKGRGKHTGLLQFYQKYQEMMESVDVKLFKERSRDMFKLDPDFFTITDTSTDYPGFQNTPRTGSKVMRRMIQRINHDIIKEWRRIRTKKSITGILGRQFTRTKEKIEIDITYMCNLRCYDCNRSCRQAPAGNEIPFGQIKSFVDDSIKKNIKWKRIRILGGEPTLHSRFEDILYELARYKLRHPRCRMEVVSNGYGRQVQKKLLQIPPFYHIENTMKKNHYQPHFYSFNMAPRDNPNYKHIDFTNGCSNIEQCGIGFTPSGYYPCAIAGGIDRVTHWNIGRQTIPSDDDNMLDLLEIFCSYCGRFDSQTFISNDITPESTPGQMSPTWKHLYDEWRAIEAAL